MARPTHLYKISLTLMVMSFFISGCGSIPALSGGGAATAKIKSIPLKIALAAGGAALQVAVEEFTGIQIDIKSLLQQVGLE